MEYNKMMLVPVMLLFAVNVVSAAGFEYDETPFLNAVYENAKCRVDFTNDLIDAMVEEEPSESDLLDYQDTLNADMSELYTLAQAGDRTGFAEHMRGTLKDDFVDTKDAMRESRGRIRNNESAGNGKMNRLRNEYNSLNETYTACNYNTMKNMARERHNWMNHVMEYWKNKSANLAQKGVDTSELDDVIDGAEETIVAPYNNEVNNAGDSSQVRAAMGKYCLGNGCAEGTNYHFYAKAESAKLNGILGYLEEDAEEAGLGSEVEEAQGYLDSANDGVQRTGYEQYAEGVAESVWDDIKSAAETVREIFGELRG